MLRRHLRKDLARTSKEFIAHGDKKITKTLYPQYLNSVSNHKDFLYYHADDINQINYKITFQDELNLTFLNNFCYQNQNKGMIT